MNNVLSHGDKRGGRPYPSWLIQGFQEAVNACGLIDLDLIGYPFTWEKGYGTDNWIECRLDWALVSQSWLEEFGLAKLTNLEISSSDHCPLLLEPIVPIIPHSQKRFKFENAWLREPMCKQLVEEVWQTKHDCSLSEKIACGVVLSDWGKELTGNFKARIG